MATAGSGSAPRSLRSRSQGHDKLTFVVDGKIESFGLWVEQLVAESLGKEGKGIVPVTDEPLGAPEAYGDDRVFCYLRDNDDPSDELDEHVRALADAGPADGHAVGRRPRRPGPDLLLRRAQTPNPKPQTPNPKPLLSLS